MLLWIYFFHSLEAYRDQDPSPDHSSGSESGSESSRSRSQSPSSSGSSSSEEGSRGESVHGTAPSSEAPPSTNRTSALCLRNISLRSGGRQMRLKSLILQQSYRDCWLWIHSTIIFGQMLLTSHLKEKINNNQMLYVHQYDQYFFQ